MITLTIIFFQAVFPKRRLQTVWEQIVFRAGTGVALDVSHFVDKVTETYNRDKVAFTKEIRAAYRSFYPIFDTNLNCRIDEHEYLLGMEAFNANNKVEELKYFRSLDASSGGVSLNDLVTAWTDFQTVATGDEADLELIQQAFDRLSTTFSGQISSNQFYA